MRHSAVGISEQHMEVVQDCPQRRALAAILRNQFDQFSLKGVFIVVDLGRLR